MKKFSLSTLFLWTALCAVGALTLRHSSLILAAIVVSLTAVLLILLAISGIRRGNFQTIGIVIACVAYLIIADGGAFPNSERYLPTERLLEKRTTIVTNWGPPKRPSKSLSLWLFQALSSSNGDQDIEYFKPSKTRNRSQKTVADDEQQSAVSLANGADLVGKAVEEGSCDSILDQLLLELDDKHSDLVATAAPVRLPFIKVTNVYTTFGDRDCWENRPYFLIGHYLFALLFAIAMLQLVQMFRKSTDTIHSGSANPA